MEKIEGGLTAPTLKILMHFKQQNAPKGEKKESITSSYSVVVAISGI